MEVRSHSTARPFRTTDGSIIRSLLDLSNAPVANHSLAEATLDPGDQTRRHHHRVSEEIYYVVEGRGLVEIDGEKRLLEVGDAVLIPINAWHQITNTGEGDLRFLCTCSPPWTADDTYLD